MRKANENQLHVTTATCRNNMKLRKAFVLVIKRILRKKKIPCEKNPFQIEHKLTFTINN